MAEQNPEPKVVRESREATKPVLLSDNSFMAVLMAGSDAHKNSISNITQYRTKRLKVRQRKKNKIRKIKKKKKGLMVPKL